MEHNKGTDEVASCLIRWLQEKDQQGHSKAIVFRDTCGRQNRIKIMRNCSAVVSCQVIEQKFFESGHSQNEGNSMRSCIQHEFEKRGTYLPLKINKKKKKYEGRLMRDFVWNFDELEQKNVQKQTLFQVIRLSITLSSQTKMASKYFLLKRSEER